MSVAELASELSAEIEGSPDRIVEGVAPLETARPSELSFFSNRKYKREYLGTKAGAVLVGREDASVARPPDATLLVVERPYVAFAKAAWRFYRPPRYPAGVDARAAVDRTAEVDPTATVMPFAYVGRGAKVGARTVIHAGCVILDGSTIGEDCLLWPGVVVREDCRLGARTIVQPGAIVGGDGFGFAFDPDGPDGMRHLKIPQMGTVRIDEDVELGANTCVDRAALGETIVGRGSKLDNLVQIAHNAEVGPLNLIAGCSAIAGSTRLGMGVVVAGQVGIVGHLDIGDGAKFAAKSGIHADVEPGAALGGWPARDHRQWMREEAALRRLPDLLKEVRGLAKRVAELEAALAAKGES